MPLRILPALCLLVLAGCTSPEPQNLAPSPPATGATVSPDAGPPRAPAGQTDAVPAAGAAVVSQQGYNCRTVGNATLCDAPPVPSDEDTLYTN